MKRGKSTEYCYTLWAMICRQMSDRDLRLHLMRASMKNFVSCSVLPSGMSTEYDSRMSVPGLSSIVSSCNVTIDL
jgi:hypothetical protein